MVRRHTVGLATPTSWLFNSVSRSLYVAHIATSRCIASQLSSHFLRFVR